MQVMGDTRDEEEERNRTRDADGRRVAGVSSSFGDGAFS